MADDDYAPGRILDPVDEVARGLRPPGPFAPALTSKDPETNIKNIGAYVNPAPQPVKTFDPFNNPQSPLPFSGGQSAPILERLGAALPMATAGFGAPSFLGKMGVAEKVAPFLERRLMDLGVGAAPSVARGDVTEGAKEGGFTALAGGGLEKGAQLLRYLTSGIPGVGSAAIWGKKTAGELADWFTKNVPEWKDIKNLAGAPVTGEKALFAMAKGEGPIKLGEAYDKALTAAKDLIPEGATVALPEGIAKALKLKMSGGEAGDYGARELLVAAKNNPNLAAFAQNIGLGQAGQVDARELLTRLPGTEGATRRAVREALGDYVPPEMLATYKKGMGLIDLADRGGERGFLAGERYNPARATQMVQEHGVEDLLRRGLGEPASIIRGPLAEPLTRSDPGYGSVPYYLGKGMGILGSGALGYATHNPMLGVAAGGLSALYPKPYRNVPPTLPQMGPVAEQALRAVMPGFLQNMRSSERD